MYTQPPICRNCMVTTGIQVSHTRRFYSQRCSGLSSAEPMVAWTYLGGVPGSKAKPSPGKTPFLHVIKVYNKRLKYMPNINGNPPEIQPRIFFFCHGCALL